MKYEEVKTEGYLSNFIKCFWTSETSSQNIEHTILPNGYFDLIVEIKNGKMDIIKLTGIWIIPIDIKTASNTKIFAVRFKPLATELLENINLKALLNSFTLVQNTVLNLDTLSFDSFAKFSRHIERYFENQIEQSRTICPRKISLFQQIFKKETFKVQELSEKSFWTSRQINRYFNSEYGISLKTYLNIVRCNSTYKNIVRKEPYHQNEYFEQAHYIKETKKYTGVAPKELNRNKNDRFLQLLTLKAF
jgi:AraC-like DNA-binding protein